MSIRIVAFLSAMALAGSAWAATLTIKADGTGAYPTIQAAINAAAPGDLVVLQPGTYTGAGNRDVDFKGKAITVRSASPDDPGVINATILDCQNAGRGFLFQTNETPASILEGLTVLNGRTDGDGAGIACHAASPTIRKCRLLTCSAGSATNAGAGGGLSLDSSAAVVSQCVFSNNSAWLGGGLYCGAGTAQVTNCLIAANTTISTSSAANALGGGGGIAFVSTNAAITNCTIVNNGSAHNRGGLYVFLGSSPATVRNCILWGNTGSQVDGAGLTLTFCDVQGAYAGLGNLSANPNLTADLHLPPTSPCLNTGDPAYLPATGETDIDWQPRVIAGRVDIGADEWTYAGDIDGDGHVDVVDLLTLAQAWGTIRGDAPYDPRSDLNSDGSVDVIDLLMLAENWGN